MNNIIPVHMKTAHSSEYITVQHTRNKICTSQKTTTTVTVMVTATVNLFQALTNFGSLASFPSTPAFATSTPPQPAMVRWHPHYTYIIVKHVSNFSGTKVISISTPQPAMVKWAGPGTCQTSITVTEAHGLGTCLTWIAKEGLSCLEATVVETTRGQRTLKITEYRGRYMASRGVLMVTGAPLESVRMVKGLPELIRVHRLDRDLAGRVDRRTDPGLVGDQIRNCGSKNGVWSWTANVCRLYYQVKLRRDDSKLGIDG
jgi:hypothetical protein